MSLVEQLALGVFLPAAVASLVMAVGIWRRSAWAGALGVAAGYVAGHLFVQGMPRQPPIAAEDWLPTLAVLGVTVAFIDTSGPASKFGRWMVGLATVVATVLLLTNPMIVHFWSTGVTAGWLTGLIVGMSMIWAMVDATASRNPGPLVPLILGLLTAALAVVQGLSSSILLARLSGAAAVTIVPLTFVTWRWPNARMVRGVLPVILVLYCGTLMAGFFYSNVSRGSALILALAPASLVLTRVGRQRRVGVGLAVVVAWAGAVSAVGIAVVTATPGEF